MIQKWLSDPIKRARQHAFAGNIELSIGNDVLAWRFDLSKPDDDSSHRVEFSFAKNKDSNNVNYKYKGMFLIPSWVKIDRGNAVIMQWHGETSNNNLFTIRINNDTLEVAAKGDGIEDILLSIPLKRDEWITIEGEYFWNTHHNGVIDGVPFSYTGRKFQNMYWKYGIYRTRHLDEPYCPVQMHMKAEKWAI